MGQKSKSVSVFRVVQKGSVVGSRRVKEIVARPHLSMTHGRCRLWEEIINSPGFDRIYPPEQPFRLRR